MACVKNSPASGVEELLRLAKLLVRSQPDTPVDPYAPLHKKSERPDILAKLAQMEQEIMARAKAQGVI